MDGVLHAIKLERTRSRWCHDAAVDSSVPCVVPLFPLSYWGPSLRRIAERFWRGARHDTGPISRARAYQGVVGWGSNLIWVEVEK